MKPNKSKNMAKAKGKPTATAMRSADLTTAQPLVLTQGNLIEGTFDVIRGATEDTLIGTVTNWQGKWWDYHFNLVNDNFTIPAGGQGATNYNELPNMAMPFTFICVVPHSNQQVLYFFGVSSEAGRNVAGKTLIVG